MGPLLPSVINTLSFNLTSDSYEEGGRQKSPNRVEVMASQVFQRLKIVIFVCCCVCLSSVKGSAVHLRVVNARDGIDSPTGPEVEVTWTLPRQEPSLSVTWHSLTYSSQVTVKEVGNHQLEKGSESFTISDGLKYNQQYRVCVHVEPGPCDHATEACGYIMVPKLHQNKSQPGRPALYLVLSPVSSKNLTVQWGEVPGQTQALREPRTAKGYRITWRRVEGLIGHPGHASNLVSSRHLIKGLIPGSRYEICVGESLANDYELTCDVITTDEDVPGPPITSYGSCTSQAQGTHWRCDVVWKPPLKTHGRIKGYVIEWKDKEGYVLMETLPKGVLCEPSCYQDQIVNFHPSEVCVSARTRAGQGWESCVPITDVSGRILAFFELKVVLIIAITLLGYQLGPALLKALFRCCVRGLYKHMEGEKKHPV